MRRHIGYWVIGTGLLHQAVGLYFYRAALVDIWQAGVFNSVVPPHWDRDAAFWFFYFGFMLLLYGAVVQWLVNQTGRVPAFMAWSLIALAGAGAVVMPASGFWLVIPLGVMMLRAGGPTTQPTPAS